MQAWQVSSNFIPYLWQIRLIFENFDLSHNSIFITCLVCVCYNRAQKGQNHLQSSHVILLLWQKYSVNSGLETSQFWGKNKGKLEGVERGVVIPGSLRLPVPCPIDSRLPPLNLLFLSPWLPVWQAKKKSRPITPHSRPHRSLVPASFPPPLN